MSEASRILVVDDDEMNRDMCSRRLMRSGFSVEVCSSGKDAMQLIDKGRYDLVLLDQMMPDMSGSEVLKALRMKYSAAELPIIMVTAVTDSSRIAEALDLGANDYVPKPIDFTVALARIRSHLSRTQIENALQRSEERYALAAMGTNDGLWDWDLRKNEINYSPRWKALLGYAPGELSNQPSEWMRRVHPRDLKRFEHCIDAHVNKLTNVLQCECRVLHKDGNYRWMAVRGVAMEDQNGVAQRMVGSQSDVTETLTLDSLTRLPNRVLFEDRLECACARHTADPSRRFALLYIDVDRFKLVNDSLGHAAGDQLLVEIATRLSRLIQDAKKEKTGLCDTIVARLGGDEFAILAAAVSDQSEAEAIAQKILEEMRPAFRLNECEVYSSFSIGIALAQTDSSPEDLLRDADTAMYAAKAQGKGRWEVFESSMQETQHRRFKMDGELRHAIENSEFEVYYQPRVKLDTQTICGFEALIRWNHPVRGIVSPTEFIPAAEENGMIHEIGIWVLREACRQTRVWNERFARETPVDIAVNLSVVQCRNPHIVGQVANVLKETGLLPRLLHLELTENILIDRFDEVRQILISLKELGVGLKIDDFGTGYSSLKYLAELPFDTLKIDRSFVKEIGSIDRDSIEIVRTIMRMAEGLKMGVIAEGVETLDQIAQLIRMGCHFGQGFYFSRPISASETESMLCVEQGSKKQLCTASGASRVGKDSL